MFILNWLCCYPSVRAFNNSLIISSLPKTSIRPFAKKKGINTTNTSRVVAKISLGYCNRFEKTRGERVAVPDLDQRFLEKAADH